VSRDEVDDGDAIYQDVVQRLREVSVNVVAVRKGMFRGGIAGLTEPTGAPLPPTLEEQFEEVEDLGKLEEQLVDVAIRQTGAAHLPDEWRLRHRV